MVAVLGYSREQIIAAVQDMYSVVATAPTAEFHFPVGREAAAALGYSPEELDGLPRSTLESFAGVGCPWHTDVIREGDTVLDIGAGAGVDALIASRRVGASGRVIAVDLTPAMVAKLAATAAENGYDNVRAMEGSAEALPLPDESVDVITSNGALNLVPDKRRAIAEMFRVLRPGGRMQISDVVIRRPVTVDCDSDPRLWVECVVGATVDEELLNHFRDAGFEGIEVVRSLDYFAHSPSAQTREIAASFDAYSTDLRLRRAQRAPSRISQFLRRADPRRAAAALWRRGLAGSAALAMALLACYGTLAAIGLLGLAGIGIGLNETVWAGAIVVFALATAGILAIGARYHGSWIPAITGGVAAAAITGTMFIAYSLAVELAGFLVLAAAVGYDHYLRRRHQSRVLGLHDSGQQATAPQP